MRTPKIPCAHEEKGDVVVTTKKPLLPSLFVIFYVLSVIVKRYLIFLSSPYNNMKTKLLFPWWQENLPDEGQEI